MNKALMSDLIEYIRKLEWTIYEIELAKNQAIGVESFTSAAMHQHKIEAFQYVLDELRSILNRHP